MALLIKRITMNKHGNFGNARKIELKEIKQAYEGGATRTVMEARYDLIPPEAIQAMALRWGLGAIKHGEGNWKSGGVAFIKACFNHLQKHLQIELCEWRDDFKDDDLGAVLWGAGALKWFQINKPAEYKQALEELGQGLVEDKPTR